MKEDKVIETFLVMEKKVLCKISVTSAPLFLLSAFFVFDMLYPKGVSSLYQLLEKVLLEKHDTKCSQIVSRLFTAITIEQ